MKIRIKNAWKTWVVVILAAIFSAAAGYYCLANRVPLSTRQAIFEQVSERRRLLQERSDLEKEIAILKALPRITLRARELLGMRLPRPDERIVVEPGR